MAYDSDRAETGMTLTLMSSSAVRAPKLQEEGSRVSLCQEIPF